MTRNLLLVPLLAGYGTLAPALLAAPWLFALEPNHSTIGFSVPIAGGLTRVGGAFTSFDADIVWEEDEPAAWSVMLRIDAASVDTNNEERDADLRGPRFFYASRHPRLLFRSRRIEKRGDRYLAIGDLTIRGVTRPVEIPFRITGVSRSDGRPLLGVSARWQLNRLDYGVGADWRHTAIPNFLGNEVAIAIDLWTTLGRRAGDPGPPR